MTNDVPGSGGVSPPERGLDVTATERWLTRAAAAVGLGACVVFLLLSPTRQVPRAALLAALGLYALSKLVVVALRVREHSSLWLATLCEVAALGVVGTVVWTGKADLISLLLVVALLLGGALWRRRHSQLPESESP